MQKQKMLVQLTDNDLFQELINRGYLYNGYSLKWHYNDVENVLKHYLEKEKIDCNDEQFCHYTKEISDLVCNDDAIIGSINEDILYLIIMYFEEQ